ncbi:MAG: hypothetical protein GC193_15065 [Cryomorphaceae bacterium]|nr:hypothetical protein [Cryomorphaceae bacterium]
MNIAVNIALIPRSAELLMSLSHQLCSEHFRLSQDAFPHVSLAMNFVNEGRVKEIADEIRHWEAIAIQCTQMVIEPSGSASNILLQVRQSNELRNLHEQAMSLLYNFRAHGADDASFVGDVSISTVNYVANFESYAFAQFSPHFTLGEAKTSELTDDFPKSLIADVALFQLGDRCTCAKRLG